MFRVVVGETIKMVCFIATGIIHSSAAVPQPKGWGE